MNANIRNFSIYIKFDLNEGHISLVLDFVNNILKFFTTKLSHLITTLTYVLMDYFNPCFNI